MAYKNGVEIPSEQWTNLRDLYKNDWPKHILTVYTLQNYIDWAEKNPNFKEGKIRSIDEKWIEHGTFVLEDTTKLHCNIFCNTLQPENAEILGNTLKLSSPYTNSTLIFVEQARLVAEQHMINHLGVIHYEDKYYRALLHHLPKEEAINLELKSMPGFTIGSLTEKHVQQIDDLWPHQHLGSDYLFKRVIRYNMTLGVFNESNGDLCAWVLHWDTGTIGPLQVEEKYKRLGLGEQLVRRICVKLAENGYDSIAATMLGNVASCKLFEKLGFKMIDRMYYLDKDAD